MAFIGSDGLENRVKQLTQQLSAKDAEISSVRDQLRKRDQALAEAKKAKDSTAYQLETEADRALKAENALQSKTTELAKTRTQMDNLQRTLHTNQEKVKAGEKENQRLQYEADVVASGSSDQPLQKLREQTVAQETKIKELDRLVKKLEQEKDSILSNVEAVRHKRALFGSSDMFNAPSPNKSIKGGRRRSDSLSSGNRIRDLEAELDALKASSGDSGALRSQLANAKRDADQAVNDKIRCEKTFAKEVAEWKSKVEDMTDELEYYRHDGESGSQVEMGKIRMTLQAVQRERDQLQTKTNDLQEEIGERTRDMVGLKSEVSKVAELEAGLQEAERKLRESSTVEAESTNRGEATEVHALKQKIALLESELTANSSLPSSGSSKELNMLKMKQQRELRDLHRRISALESDLEDAEQQIVEKDERLLRMTSNIPIPDSPSLGSRALSNIDNAEMETLRAELATLRSDLIKKSSQHKEETRSLERAAARLEKELEGAISDLRNQQAAYEVYRGEQESYNAQRDAFEVDLLTIRERLADKEKDVTTLESELTKIHSQFDAEQQIAADLRSQLHDRGQVLEILRSEMAAISKKKDELEITEFGRRQERDIAQEEVTRLRVGIAELQDAQRKAEETTQEAITANTLRITELTAELSEARSEVDCIQTRLEEGQVTLAKITAVSENFQERYEEAETARLTLRERIAELEGAVSNRSTESEAQLKDEHIFQLKDDLTKAQATLANERKRGRQEVESAVSAKNSAAEEARQQLSELSRRIADLEQQIRLHQTSASEVQAKSKTELKNVSLLHAKMSQLRAERNQLRQDLSFAETEGRFGMKAAQADRLSAIDELRSTQTTLNEKTERLEVLQTDSATIRSRLTEVSTALAAASADKAQLELSIGQLSVEASDLQIRIKDLEDRDVVGTDAQREQGVQLLELSHHLTITRNQLALAQKELRQHQTAVSHFEKRNDELQATVDGQDGEDAAMPLPRFRSHVKRQSGIPSTESLQNLQEQIADQKARVLRREATIKALEVESKKLRLNLQLMEESKDESDDSIRDLTSERDVLQVRLSAVEGDMVALAASEADQRESSANMIRQLVIAISIQRRAVTQASRRQRNASKSLGMATIVGEQLREENSVLETTRLQVDTMKDRIVELETAVQTAASELIQVQECQTTAQADYSALQGDLKNTAEQLADARHTAVEVVASRARAADLETRLSISTERAQVAEDDIGALLAKMASAEKSLKERGSVANTETAILLARVAELEGLLTTSEERISGLQSELKTILDDLAAVEKSQSDAEIGHVTEIRALQSFHATELEAASTRLRDAEKERAESVLTGGKAHDETVRLQVRLEEELDHVKEATSAANEQRMTIEHLTSQVKHLEEMSANTDVDRLASGTRINDVESQLAHAETRAAKLEEEFVAVLKQHASVADDLAITLSRLEVAAAGAAGGEEAGKLRMRVDELEKQLHDSEKSLKSREEQTKRLAESAKKTEKQLFKVQEDLARSNAAVNQQENNLARLAAENEKIKSQLAAFPVKAEQSGAMTDLKERIEDLEASLAQKTQEVDEADDRTREMYKTNAKLQKKVAKLERQLTPKPAAPVVAISHATDDITRRNTIANETISVLVPKAMAPPLLPLAAKLSPNPVMAATPSRQPLRPVANIFESTTPSIVGAKRAREAEVDKKLPPVEFITLPPTSAAVLPSSVKRTPGRQGFTPTRGGGAGAGNAFRPVSAGAGGEAAGRALAKNAFARPSSVGGAFGVGQRDNQL